MQLAYNSAMLKPRAPGLSFMARKRVISVIILVVTLICIFFVSFSSPTVASAAPAGGKNHGLYLHEFGVKSPLMFPAVENTHILREMGLSGLFINQKDQAGKLRYFIKIDDMPGKSREESKDSGKVENQLLKIKQNFLDLGKQVFTGPVSPEVVVVTLIDFQEPDAESIVKVVQNRVDYAQAHKYGVYVRWVQEFLPAMQKHTVEESYEFAKPMVMMAAMHAFPETKWFWFVDKNGLIMQYDVPFLKKLEQLDSLMIRGQPIVDDVQVKSYMNTHGSDAELIFSQYDKGIDTASFAVKNTLVGKVAMNYLCDPLVRNYNWAQEFRSALGHIFQWHPSLLAKLALIPTKTLAALADSQTIVNDAYAPGDLVAMFRNCKGSCGTQIEDYYGKIVKTNK